MSLNLPLQEHLTTGIVFASGETMSFYIGDFNALTAWRINWSGYLVSGGSSSIDRQEDGESLTLQGSPNPSNGHGRIDFALPASGAVVLAVFDVSGRKVRTLIEGHLDRGVHTLTWDGRGDDGRPVPEGVYFARLEREGGAEVHKLVRGQ